MSKGTLVPSITRGLRRASDLSISRQRFLLVLVSTESSILYTPTYLEDIFHDPLREVIGTSNAGMGELFGYYATAATTCYFLSGTVADKVRVCTLTWVGFTSMAMLTYFYAILPSFAILRLVFTDMGMTTILTQWGIRFKLVRLISGGDTHSHNIGTSYGLYGVTGLTVGLSDMGIIRLIVSAFGGSDTLGIQALLFSPGTLILVLGVLSSLYIPKFEGEIDPMKKSFDVHLIREMLRNPVVQTSAACLFYVYFFYTGLNYATPYLIALLASRILTGVVSILRTYGITLASGSVFGLLTKTAGSPSKAIFGGLLVCADGMLVLATLSAKSVMIILVAMFTTLLGFIANGVSGIVLPQLTEGKVPTPIFGTAADTLSVVGLSPDSFFSTRLGKTIGNQGRGAYAEIFLILTGFAVTGVAPAIVLPWYVKRRRGAGQVGLTPPEPTPVPSYEEAAEPAAIAKSAFDSERDPDKGLAQSSHAE